MRQGWWWKHQWMMWSLCRWNVITPLMWQITVCQMWLVQQSNEVRNRHWDDVLGDLSQDTYASVARRFRFNPLLPELLKLLSFDKKISLWASVGLCNNSITLLSLVLTYCKADCLLTRAELLISRCRSGKWDLRKGNTFGRSGKFVASCTAIWNSSIDSPPLCN